MVRCIAINIFAETTTSQHFDCCCSEAQEQAEGTTRMRVDIFYIASDSEHYGKTHVQYCIFQ